MNTCPHCLISPLETWFDRSIQFDSKGNELEFETFATRCCNCGKNVDAPKDYYKEN